jgi:glycerol-3-phosphate dehydrogenase (NAD(P)+)
MLGGMAPPSPASPGLGSRVLILGYGSFGRAVHAAIGHRDDLSISVYSRSPKDYLRPPRHVFDQPSTIRRDELDVVIVALPGHAMRDVLRGAFADAPAHIAFLSCVKGMEPETGALPSDVIYQATGSDHIAVMSGASFADEMLSGRPVFLTLACANLLLGADLIDRLRSRQLHLELTDDVRGLEVAGVGKNIIALGAGLADGVGLGDNFRAAFIARGVVELRTVADRLGGRADTIVAAGALADFFLSCSSPRSRNYAHGVTIGRGGSQPEALAEGRHSASSFVAMLHEQQIRSPFFETIVRSLADPPLIAASLPGSAGSGT